MVNIQNLFSGLSIVVMAVILILGIMVVSRASKTRANYIFFVFIISIVLWLLVNFLLRFNFLGQSTFYILEFSFSVPALMIFLLFLFSAEFPNRLIKSFKFVYAFALVPLIYIFYLAHTDAIVTGFERQGTIVSAQYGWGFILFAIYTIVYLLLTFTMIYLQYKTSSEEVRRQVFFLFIGILVSGIVAVVADLAVPLIFNTNVLANFDSLGIIFLVIFTTYAILKHHLLDIKVILVETATILVSLAILAQTLLSQGFWEGFVNAIILLLVVYGGYLITKSVQNEIRQKEELQILSKQLEQANTHLKELDAMKTEFVSLASHELLTPVSAIEGYLSMLLDEKMARVDDPKAKKYLDNVYLSAKRLARLIADMLNISRIEEGRLSVEKSDVNVGDMINQVIDEIRFKAEERKQKIVFDNLQPSTVDRAPSVNSQQSTVNNYMTYGDPDKIKEIIINIIGNSIKYSMNPGTVTITVQKVPRQMVDSTWARIEADIKNRPLDDQEAIKSAVNPHYRELVGDEQLMISVKDQGVGIPREELPRLFKKFHRVGNYSTQESQGTGLGLYISRALVELQHGRIWADSEGEGKGSTFTFTMPELAVKDQILALEKQIPMDKEQMKPLARPMKSAAEEL